MEDDELQKQLRLDEESASTLGASFLELLSPSADECTAMATSVRASQIQLETQLDRLEVELNRANASLAIPFDPAVYTKKILDCKKRLAATMSRMNTVESRVKKMTEGLKKAVPDAFNSHTVEENHPDQLSLEIKTTDK